MSHATATLERLPVTPAAGPAVERLAELETIFSRMRTAASLRHVGALPGGGGLHRFASAVVTRDEAWAADVTHEPGLFPVGATWVRFRVRVGADEGARSAWTVEADGRFCVVVTDDAGADVPTAEWTFRDAAGDGLDAVDVPWAAQLPTSVLVPRLASSRLTRAVNRALYDGEAARSDLLASQCGLVHKVVGQYRRQLQAEACALDVEDLEQVGLQRLLELAERRYAGAAHRRPSTAAWSKVAMREVGNAVKAGSAAMTGVSVEFRQLLTWFRAHPGDRNRPAAEVAEAMAFAAGVTRLVQAHLATDRSAATSALAAMLADGRAAYAAPGLDADERAQLRTRGTFVISPRSSLAEIERGERHGDLPPLALDAPAGAESDTALADVLLAQADDGFAAVELELFLKHVFAETGMTALEADVWTARSGVRGPADELPEIATDLGLEGRAEARAALRRAWRKLSSVGEELRRAAA